MVLQIAYAAISYVLPPKYYLHAAVAIFALVIAHAWVRGRATRRERDLHARTVIVTGSFTPLGLTLITDLARRGAHIIALSPYELTHPIPAVLVPLLRSTTNNENIFAEHADLSSPSSIRAFCTKFLTTENADTRIDAMVFAHEYSSIGSPLGFLSGRKDKSAEVRERERASLATFLLVTLLLPALLVAPAERDIRICTLINPFYAAATVPFFGTLAADRAASQPALLAEGTRGVRAAVLMRHLQRILDSLPNQRKDVTEADKALKEGRPVQIHSPSNIVAVTVCPGLSRKDTAAPLLCARRDAPNFSVGGLIIYTLLFPVLYLLTKPPTAALQTILHALFLPTPFKRAQARLDATANPEGTPADSVVDDEEKKTGVVGEEVRERRTRGRVVPEEVLKPGALYRECAIVPLEVPPPPAGGKQANEKGAAKEGGANVDPVPLEDDGEMGGEALGRAVWEWYEARLNVWEHEDKEREEEQKVQKEREKAERRQKEFQEEVSEEAPKEGEKRVRFAAS